MVGVENSSNSELISLLGLKASSPPSSIIHSAQGFILKGNNSHLIRSSPQHGAQISPDTEFGSMKVKSESKTPYSDATQPAIGVGENKSNRVCSIKLQKLCSGAPCVGENYRNGGIKIHSNFRCCSLLCAGDQDSRTC
eukprot:TRINITY_DN698_c0_g1_i3.p1 TRINITY_DN698_c0_g1~~TRINITY_DN698_c0_g1_i3.p1  ORF type:complete len:138 (-),score=19.61 TRINITY_DN698_c0_g1_i3:311-724(-)